jgi:hypothetical protein
MRGGKKNPADRPFALSPAYEKTVTGKVDTERLEKEFSFQEKAGFKNYKKKVGLTSTRDGFE